MDGCGTLLDCFFFVEKVGVVVLGDGDVDEGQLADGAVPAAGLDEDGGQGLDGNHFAIQFEKAFSFENEVNFGRLLMVVAGGLVFDLEEMNGSRSIGQVRKAAAGGAAAAIDFG